jgi:hypothetical protein
MRRQPKEQRVGALKTNLSSKQEFVNLLLERWEDPEELAGVIQQINRWLARGDGAALYVNADLSHPGLGGEVKIVSFGSSEAQLEVPEPPLNLPDIGRSINWRFYLKLAYRGEAL